MSESKRIVRQDAMDVVAESGLSTNRNFLATKASQSLTQKLLALGIGA
jgi:hypothetical protein